MAGSKAKRIPNVWDRLRESQNKQLNEEAVSRRRFNPQTISIPPSPEIPPTGNTGNQSDNDLATSGGTMVGVIAYHPKSLAITDEVVGKPSSATSRTLDISQAVSNDTSRVLLTGLAPSDDLEFINGAQHAGQYLNIQGTATQTIIIKDDPSGTGSEGFNIRTQSGDDLILEGNANMELIFDSTTSR